MAESFDTPASEGIALEVNVDGHLIIVTMPGACFRATYFLSPEPTTLTQSNIMVTDGHADISRSDFETRAWEAANAKARELGWIV